MRWRRNKLLTFSLNLIYFDSNYDLPEDQISVVQKERFLTRHAGSVICYCLQLRSSSRTIRSAVYEDIVLYEFPGVSGVGTIKGGLLIDPLRLPNSAYSRSELPPRTFDTSHAVS